MTAVDLSRIVTGAVLREMRDASGRNPAACLDERPEFLFPIGNAGSAALQIEKAKAVCRRCAIDEACVKWAIESGQDAGVWGGLSEDERHALKRRNARNRGAS